MANTGWKFPGTAVGNRTITGSDVDWSDPDNIKAVANTSLASLLVIGDTSSGLAASNFDFSSIPSGATIDGIEVRVGDYRGFSGLPDIYVCKLILADNSDGSEDKEAEILDPLTDATRTDEAGGPADLWSETISVANVKDIDFGFFIGFTNSTAADNGSVGFLQMRVHYTFAGVIQGTPGLAGYSPPFKSSGGSFYVIARTSDEAIDAYKASDPTDSWTVQDATGNPTMDTNGGNSAGYILFSVVQKADILYIITWGNSWTGGRIYEYSEFNMATDNWDVVDEIINLPADSPTFPWASIAVRSDGDVVVVYAGDTDQNMGGKKERVDVNIRTSGTWGGPVALDPGFDIHYGNPNCILGTNDGVHIHWQKQSAATPDPPTSWGNAEGQSKTLNSSDVLSGDRFGTDTLGSLLGMSNMVTWDDAGTQRVVIIGVHSATQRSQSSWTEDGSDNLSTLNRADDATGEDPYVNGEVGVLTTAELSTDLHVLFSGGGADGVDQDLYYTKSTDIGVNWDTPTEEIDAITCNYISANIYVRGSDTVLAYVYDDGGVQKYNEKVLRFGFLTSVFKPRPIGVGYC